MLTLATFESTLGSVWFACFLGALGYIAGHIVTIDRIRGWFSSKPNPPTP